jgi:hypothetical protein
MPTSQAPAFTLPDNNRKDRFPQPPGSVSVSRDIPFEASGTVSVGALTGGDYSFGKTTAGYTLARKRLQVGPIQTEFMGGEIRGRGTVDFNSPLTPVDCSVAFERLRVQNISPHERSFQRPHVRIWRERRHRGTRILTVLKTSTFANRSGVNGVHDRPGKLVDTGIQKRSWNSPLRPQVQVERPGIQQEIR